MSSIIFSILSIYVFIVMGYLAKMSFKEQIDDKTITLINVYFLQVFLTFWGLLIHPIDVTLLYAPSIYLLIVVIALIISALFARYLFENKKEYSIAMVTAIIGNTGNLGIPINIAIFGEESIPYTTIVNLVNVFVVYTIGVYYYSRGSFDKKTSFMNIVKLPILWAAIIAILLSVYEVQIHSSIMNMLMMGAYASMTMQLFLFGIYLYGIQIKEVSKKLVVWVLAFKFISRGSFDKKTSFMNIVKLPILWAAIIAILLSVYEVQIHSSIMNMLMMGAYASMTMQLFLFGIYYNEPLKLNQ